MNLLLIILSVVALILIIIIFWKLFKKYELKDWLIFKRITTKDLETSSCYIAVHKAWGITTGCYVKIKDLFEEIDDNSIFSPVD